MEYIQEFRKKNQNDLMTEYNNIRQKYPDRIPVLVDRARKEDPKLDKNKYLCPTDLTLGQFVNVIRKRLKVGPEQALYFFVGRNTLVPLGHCMTQVFAEHAVDGFLEIKYCKESTFGQ